jgi:hypothetical protein
MLPFSREQFFDVFARYNEAVWPAQIVLLAIAIAMVGAARLQKEPRWVGWALGGMWLWTGVAYHAVFFAPINGLANGFAVAFMLQGALIARAAYRQTLRISVPPDIPSAVAGALLLAYALVGYPIVALLTGQSYPAMPTFGVPCPTVIFTFGLLAWSGRVPWSLLVIPIVWAAIGISAAMQLGVPEDWGLPVAAVAVAILRLRTGGNVSRSLPHIHAPRGARSSS